MPAREPMPPTAPVRLDRALTRLKIVRAGEAFTREGLRSDLEYRDLGVAEATGGRIGVKHVRALGPFEQPTGWHWHDMTGHVVYVLRGRLALRFDGHPDEVVLHAGDCVSQPAGVPHNVVGRSDDLELIEINLPARYGTYDLERKT